MCATIIITYIIIISYQHTVGYISEIAISLVISKPDMALVYISCSIPNPNSQTLQKLDASHIIYPY